MNDTARARARYGEGVDDDDDGGGTTTDAAAGRDDDDDGNDNLHVRSSLRRALHHCRERRRDGLAQLPSSSSSSRRRRLCGAAIVSTIRDARRAASDVELDRDAAGREFWDDRVAEVTRNRSEGELDVDLDSGGAGAGDGDGDRDHDDRGCVGGGGEGRDPPSSTTRTSVGGERCPWRRMMSEEYHHNCPPEEEKSSPPASCSCDDNRDATILDFKRRVVHRNVPCLLRGIGGGDDARFSSPFAPVNRMWRRRSGRKDEEEEDGVGVGNGGDARCENAADADGVDGAHPAVAKDGAGCVSTMGGAPGDRHHDGGSVVVSVDGEEKTLEVNNGGINVDWFLEHVPNYTVPVKTCTPAPISTSSSRCSTEGNANGSNGDDDYDDGTKAPLSERSRGAVEDNCCTTTTTTVRDWIEGGGRLDPTSYLKDWHFVRAWEAEGRRRRPRGEEEDARPPLYTVPQHFRPDVLNPYLCRFFFGKDDLSSSASSDCGNRDRGCEGEGEGECAGDDYRFVYWGPAGSTTPIHSDVLNTHSWSYNVSGRKRWTFYHPPHSPPLGGYNNDATCDDDDGGDHSRRHYGSGSVSGSGSMLPTPSPSPPAVVESFDVVQEGGECIFVPSGWRHSVINLTETLSVNHNWISPSILEKVWHGCLLEEICAIEKELDGWGILPLPASSAEDGDGKFDGDEDVGEAMRVREEMLLGCAGGMNVASFFMMVLVASWDHLVEATELLTEVESSDQTEAEVVESRGGAGSGAGAKDEAGAVVVNLPDVEGTSRHHCRSPRLWEVSFDLALLGRAMSMLLRSDDDDDGDGDGDGVVRVERNEGGTSGYHRHHRHRGEVHVGVTARLAVGLGSHDLAREAVALGVDVVDRIGDFFRTPDFHLPPPPRTIMSQLTRGTTSWKEKHDRYAG